MKSSRLTVIYFISLLFLSTVLWNADETVLDPEEAVNPVVVMVGEALEDEVEEEVQGELPKHHRCAAHIVNLMATADGSKVTFLGQDPN